MFCSYSQVSSENADDLEDLKNYVFQSPGQY